MEELAEAERPIGAGRHRLLLGDCLAVLPDLDAGSVDVVVTSPPYNLGLAYSGYDDRLAEDEYLAWLERIAVQVQRVMKPEGSFFLNISGSSSAPWMPFELIVRLRPLFALQNHIVWIKSIATRDDANIARRGHPKDLRCRGNTWFIPYDTVQSKAAKFHHPSTFPIALPRWCIRLHGREDAVVLDPFMGTGTTVVATELENARGIGIDSDASYVAIAQRRLAEVRRVQHTLADI